MDKVKRKWEMLTDEKRKAAISEIISFFKSERGEEIGVIAAEDVLDMFLREVGPNIYNKGVEDAKTLIRGRVENLEFDLDALRKK